jgi:hypothetical protein
MLALGCSDSTLAECENISADGEVSIVGTAAPEFSWEGGPADEILVARTGDGVEVWNVYVDSDDRDTLNQISSPVSYGSLPSVGEDVDLVEVVEAGDLEIGVQYQVQVFIQCEEGGDEDQVGTWTVE